MNTRAVHLEVVEKLNADNTLFRLSDFINRRGIPAKIRSDCASYFKCAKKRLHEILNSPKILDNMTKKNIEWVHNCPATPHTGGAWERLIRSVRRILEFSLKDITPTVDTFRSFTINAENILNNRPLTEPSINLNDEEPLTPNHFILGSANNWQLPINEEKISLRKQLNILKAMKKRCWKKWVNEYIHIHNKRPKWFQDNTRDISPNEFVFVEHQGEWVKGVVSRIVPNKEKKVRFLEIKTRNGVLKKHASHILFPNIEEGGDC